jgi:uncharacterized protein involved in exopolysaccharide biosynthesis
MLLMTEKALAERPPAVMSGKPKDEISVDELLAILWQGRFLILVMLIVFGGGILAYGLMMPRQYQAFITVLPAEGNASQSAGVGALLSQVGGLASLAGLTGAADSKRTEAVAVLQSEALTERYISENNLLSVLYRKNWDTEKKAWKVENKKDIPTVWKANRYFKNKIRGVSEEKSGLITMRITWGDPKLAAQWANGLVEMTNQFLRDKAIAESERNIAYLNAEAAKTNVVEVRNAIFSAMQAEIKTEMMARGTDEFALRVIDPAIPPEIPSNPAWWLWLLGGLLAGALVSVPVLLVRPRSQVPY